MVPFQPSSHGDMSSTPRKVLQHSAVPLQQRGLLPIKYGTHTHHRFKAQDSTYDRIKDSTRRLTGVFSVRRLITADTHQSDLLSDLPTIDFKIQLPQFPAVTISISLQHAFNNFNSDVLLTVPIIIQALCRQFDPGFLPCYFGIQSTSRFIYQKSQSPFQTSYQLGVSPSSISSLDVRIARNSTSDHMFYIL